MTTKARGVATLTIDGVELKLRLGMNALCALEEKFDKGIQEIFESMRSNPRLTMIRTVFFHALQEFHADTIKTEADAAKLIDKSSLADVTAAFGEASKAAFGEQKGGDAVPLEQAPATPPAAAGNGTG